MSNKLNAARVSIFVNIGLLISKIIVAILTRSIALFAECTHSLFDLIASALAFIGIKAAEKPCDEDHPFGHEKFETLSSALQALLIALTALFILYESYHKFKNPTVVENANIGIILMIITIPIAILTSRYLSKIAAKSGGSQALEADSAHFVTDVLASVAVLIGLIAVKLGFILGDILAAVVVSLIMFYISFTFIKESYLVFMDYSPDEKIMRKIKTIISRTKGIKHHKLKARRAGSKIFVNFHIQVSRNMTVAESHGVAKQLKLRLKEKIPHIADVTIHVEPDEDKKLK